MEKSVLENAMMRLNIHPLHLVKWGRVIFDEAILNENTVFIEEVYI